MDKFDAMTVNERLYEAQLVSAYDAARSSGDLANINAVLRQVNLQQDANGMNWPLNAQD